MPILGRKVREGEQLPTLSLLVATASGTVTAPNRTRHRGMPGSSKYRRVAVRPTMHMALLATYVPTCGSPEWYATEVATARRKTEEAGRDPDAMIFYLLAMNIIDETEEKIDQHTHDPIARWDAAAVIPGPNVYQAWGLGEHPIRPDYSYTTHLLPTEWSREDALKIIDKTPPEVVRRARACGTPKSVADQLQAYIAAVPESNEVWVNVINYTSFLGSGNFGDPADQVDLVLESCNHLRALNGQSIPEKAPTSVGAS
jgi:phthiodiolone/phenolphthiodiolone dimycocerosates ketoreductase